MKGLNLVKRHPVKLRAMLWPGAISVSLRMRATVANIVDIITSQPLSSRLIDFSIRRDAFSPFTSADERIWSNDVLVMSKGDIHDAVLKRILREIADRILELVGLPLRDDLTGVRATILIGSPEQVTSYHADADINFRMQVSGGKLPSVVDQTDRTLVDDGEIERFFAGEKYCHPLPARQAARSGYP